MKPTVSVVIPAYNCARFIAATIRSALGQLDEGDMEIIAVDDGSTDPTREILHGLGDAVRVVEQQNAGAAAARNRGIEAARGRYVAFLDGDDLWLPGKLRAQLARLREQPMARLCHAGWQQWPSLAPEPGPGELQRLSAEAAAQPQRWQGLEGWGYADFLERGSIVWTTTVMAKRTLLEDLGGFDNSLRIGEDYDLWLRASRVTQFVHVPQLLALYRTHPGSLTRQVPAENYEATVVLRALERWGYKSPNGRDADRRTVHRSLARTWHGYGAEQLKAGRAPEALRACGLALREDWQHVPAWKLGMKALARQILPAA